MACDSGEWSFGRTWRSGVTKQTVNIPRPQRKKAFISCFPIETDLGSSGSQCYHPSESPGYLVTIQIPGPTLSSDSVVLR